MPDHRPITRSSARQLRPAPGARWTLVLLFAAACCSPSWAALARRKVIIDQDAFGPGGPNLQPLLMVLNAPDVEVLGITVESGDGWLKENVAHTLRMLELVGRTEVPVVPGATLPLLNTPEGTKRWEALYGPLVYKGAWTEVWPVSTVRRPPFHGPEIVPPLVEGMPTLQPRAEAAADFLVREVRAHPGEVSILALGPLTNVALAAKLDDQFGSQVREIVVMGGSFHPRSSGDEFAAEYMHTPRLEFNFRWDPEAAEIVLRTPWPASRLVPVDPTTSTLMRPEMIAALKAAAPASRVARYVAEYAEGYPLWDELAAATWLDGTLVTHDEHLALAIDTQSGGPGYGNTLSWPAGHGPGPGERDWDVVFAVDVPRLEQLVVKMLTRPDEPGR